MKRSKQDMLFMENECTLYLLRTNLDYNKAYDLFIKEYLTEGKTIPYYIKGIKDFKKISEKLSLELKMIETMNKSDRERFENDKMQKEKILTLQLKDLKLIYNENKSSFSENEKLLMVDILVMKMNNELKINDLNNNHIRIFKKLEVI